MIDHHLVVDIHSLSIKQWSNQSTEWWPRETKNLDMKPTEAKRPNTLRTGQLREVGASREEQREGEPSWWSTVGDWCSHRCTTDAEMGAVAPAVAIRQGLEIPIAGERRVAGRGRGEQARPLASGTRLSVSYAIAAPASIWRP
jgi:hypothetical protein